MVDQFLLCVGIDRPDFCGKTLYKAIGCHQISEFDVVLAVYVPKMFSIEPEPPVFGPHIPA